MGLINKIKKISSKTWIKIILVSIFLMMLVLNILTPLIADDYSYSFIHGTTQRVKNILDVFVSQADHYMTWGGRSIAHGIAQIFLMFPKIIFSICNSIVYTLVIYLIYKNTIDKKDKPLLMILIHFLLYFCLPVFGQNCIWLIGSCNYLWTTMFILLFVLLFRKERKDNIINIILMFILGLIAGWSNENSSFALIVITVLLMIPFKKINIKKWKISGLLGVITGFVVMILAPGNFVRKENFTEDPSFIMRIINRGIQYSETLVKYMLPLIILAVILITIHIYKKKKINKYSFVYFIASFFAVYSMLLSPQFPDRSWISPILFMIMGNIVLVNDIYDVHRVLKYILADFIVLSSIHYFGTYALLAKDINNLRVTWRERINYINKIKKDGEKSVEFKRYLSDNKRNPNYGLVDLTPMSDQWPDRDIARYYGLDSISGKTD